jgi:hypothetical protein
MTWWLHAVETMAEMTPAYIHGLESKERVERDAEARRGVDRKKRSDVQGTMLGLGSSAMTEEHTDVKRRSWDEQSRSRADGEAAWIKVHGETPPGACEEWVCFHMCVQGRSCMGCRPHVECWDPPLAQPQLGQTRAAWGQLQVHLHMSE